MSMHAGHVPASLLSTAPAPVSAPAPAPAPAPMEQMPPVTPGRKLANFMLPSERRRLTVGPKTFSPAPAPAPAIAPTTGPRNIIAYNPRGNIAEAPVSMTVDAEVWGSAHAFDARVDSEAAAAARAMANNDVIKRSSIYYGAVRVPATTVRIKNSFPYHTPHQSFSLCGLLEMFT